MTEQEWLASTDPSAMLTHLLGEEGEPGAEVRRVTGTRPSDRKLRLYACVCSRVGVRHEVYRGRGVAVLRSTEAAEAAVDGGPRHTILDRDPALAARTEMEIVLALHSGLGGPLAGVLRDVVGNPFRPLDGSRPVRDERVCEKCGHRSARHPGKCAACGSDHVRKWRVRDTWGWLTPAVRGIARRAYDLHDWEALPVLADALQEAGCDDEDVLMHCRGKGRCPDCLGKGGCCSLKDEPGVWGEMHRCALCAGSGWVDAGPLHVRGCHVLDLVLGRG
jgi:ribosomal protein L37E